VDAGAVGHSNKIKVISEKNSFILSGEVLNVKSELRLEQPAGPVFLLLTPR
jgi:hypothetical protein